MKEAKKDGIENEPLDYLGPGLLISLSTLSMTYPLLAPILPAVSGVLGVIFSNLHAERMVKYARNLESRISMFEKSILSARLPNENFSDLLEESLRQAAHSLSDERREHIANLIANSLTSDEIEFIEVRHLLRILGEINDVEILWLKWHQRDSDEYELLEEKHKEVFEPRHPALGDPEELKDRFEFQTSYKEHLTRLGLLAPQYELGSFELPDFDRFSGNPKIRNYRITRLGTIMVRYIESPNPSAETDKKTD